MLESSKGPSGNAFRKSFKHQVSFKIQKQTYLALNCGEIHYQHQSSPVIVFSKNPERFLDIQRERMVEELSQIPAVKYSIKLIRKAAGISPGRSKEFIRGLMVLKTRLGGKAC